MPYASGDAQTTRTIAGNAFYFAVSMAAHSRTFIDIDAADAHPR